MEIAENNVVSLTYTLRIDNQDGQLVEQVTKEQPFTFLFGAGNLLEQFESNLKGSTQGDEFEFTIASDNAYGPFRPEAIVQLPKEIFVVEGKLQEDLLTVGNYIAMKDEQGNPHNGKVLEIEESTVRMDFNHPLAGKDLHFSGEVVEVREATDEEKQTGQAG